MKYKKLCLMLATALCVSMCTACGNNADATATEQTEAADQAAADSEALGETDGPVIEEHFEDENFLAEARGDVTLEIVDGGVDDSKALLISGRTESWNGANYPCDEFRGNTIRVNANLKSAAKNLRLSIQYDVDGITSYNWITTGVGNADTYTFMTGTYTIPDDVENIVVYVESDATDDIMVDDLVIKTEGKYVAPGEIQAKEMADTSDYGSIKDAYSDYFDIGVCINPAIIDNEAYANLVLKEFNSVTLENNMKPEAILDKEASLNDLENGGEHFVVDMSGTEAELKFAVDNKLKVRGHTLIWHSQTPDWIFYVDYDTTGELASRELMLTRVDNYMKDVFTWAEENYDGTFYAWDVVNEAMNDNGTMRDSLWYQTIGEDYIEQVFAIARKYAPDNIKLFYNDYNAFQSSKQNAIIEALKPVAEAGNIDGVGMQAHLYTGEEPEHFVSCAKRYADELGVVIHITEIDVEQPSDTSPEGAQGKYYGELFAALKNAKADGVPIESVSIWGLTDSLSWKANNKPLLFNGDLSAKNAFYEVLQAAEE